MGEAAGITGEAPEMAELWLVSNLLAEDIDARIPEVRWREQMLEIAGGTQASSTSHASIRPSPAAHTPLSSISEERLLLPTSTDMEPLADEPPAKLSNDAEDASTAKTAAGKWGKAVVGTATRSSAAETNTTVSSTDANGAVGSTETGPMTAAPNNTGSAETGSADTGSTAAGTINTEPNTAAVASTPESQSLPSATPIIPPPPKVGPTVSGAAEANANNPPALVARSPPRRAKTGVKKIMEVVIPQRRRVTLNVKPMVENVEPVPEEEEDGEEEQEREEEQESGSEWGGEMEVDKPRVAGPSRRRRTKRRRVVSAPTIHSDGEEELPEEDGWPTEPSRSTCITCAEGGWTCKVFVMQDRGRQRFACQMCKHLKRGCSIMPARRREGKKLRAARRRAIRRTQSRAEEEDEEDEEEDQEDEEEEPLQGKRQRSRSVTRSKTRPSKKAKTAMGHGSRPERSQGRSQQRLQLPRAEPKPPQSQRNRLDGVDGSQAPDKKGKGKSKADDDDDDMESDAAPLPMKMEGEAQFEWWSSEFLQNFFLLLS